MLIDIPAGGIGLADVGQVTQDHAQAAFLAGFKLHGDVLEGRCLRAFPFDALAQVDIQAAGDVHPVGVAQRLLDLAFLKAIVNAGRDTQSRSVLGVTRVVLSVGENSLQNPLLVVVCNHLILSF